MIARTRFLQAILATFLLLVVARLAPGAGALRWERCSDGLDLGSASGVTGLAAGGKESVTAYAIIDGVGLVKSLDAGKKWAKIDSKDAMVATPYTVSVVADEGKIVYGAPAAAGQGLWMSSDAGVTWKQLATSKKGLASDDVEAITLSPADPKLILVGHRAGKAISVSADGGETWQAIALPSEVNNQLPLIIDGSRWVVCTRGGASDAGGHAMLCTDDAGKTWVQGTGDVDYMAGKLPVAQVGENLFTNRHHGTNKSQDGGKTWKFQMENHVRVIGSVGQVMFREGGRTNIRGTENNILNLELSDNLAGAWSTANFNLLAIVPEDLKPNLIIPAKVDPFAHVRIATAWASCGNHVFLGLGKAGVYHSRLLWDENGPRMGGATIAPTALPEGDTTTRIKISVAASTRKAPVARVYADLSALNLPELELFDDGKHDDGEAGDRVYGNSFVLSKTASAGQKAISVVSVDNDGRSSSVSANLEIASAAEKIIVWDGGKFNRGQGWVAPQKTLNTLKAQTEEVHNNKVALELHGEGGGYIGGGWNWHGWYPAGSGDDIRKYRNLSLWVKLEVAEGDKTGGVTVQLISANEGATGTADLGTYCRDLGDGQWHEVIVPLSDMYASAKKDAKVFDPSHVWMINVSTWTALDRVFSFYMDEIGFDNRKARPLSTWVTDAEAREPTKLTGEIVAATATVDTKAAGTPISPYIYGTAMTSDKLAKEIGLTARRCGGNPITALSWKTGFGSKGADWFYTNEGQQTPPEENWMVRFHGTNKAAGLESYLSMPFMGRVAKDSTSFAFDIKKYPDQIDWAGKQQPTDPHANAGKGLRKVKGPDGEFKKNDKGEFVTEEIEPDPNDTSVAMSPEEQTDMLKFMIDKMGYGTADKGGVKFIALDNEPGIWHATHRGMHPTGISYDELWQRTRDYATLLKKIDPAVKIAGPTAWGWTEYFFSGLDSQLASRGKTSWKEPSDFAAHGKVPLSKWYLQQIAAYKKQTGVQLVDIFDWHFYPQTGIYMAGKANDPKVMEGRVQETRVLWDPTWKDPTWMGDNIEPKNVLRIIRLMKEWVAETNPGMQTCLGEYSFGGEADVSGGVAQSEILGVFAREGLDHAYFWFAPAANDSCYFAFKMYRNPDGKHTVFGDHYLPVNVTLPDDVSLHAAKDSATGKLTFIAINKRAAKSAKVTIKLGSAIKEQDLVTYEYGMVDSHCIGELPARKVSGTQFDIELPPLTVQRFDLLP